MRATLGPPCGLPSPWALTEVDVWGNAVLIMYSAAVSSLLAQRSRASSGYCGRSRRPTCSTRAVTAMGQHHTG